MSALLHVVRAVIACGVISVMLVALSLLVTWGIPANMAAIRDHSLHGRHGRHDGDDMWSGYTGDLTDRQPVTR